MSAIAAMLAAASLATARAAESISVSWHPNAEADVSGYTVYLGTRSGQYDVRHTLSENRIVLSDLQPATTYYVAVQAHNLAGLSSGLSAEAVFTTSDHTGFFVTWAAAAGLTGSAAELGAAPHGDGVSNLLKYAFNLDPAGPSRYSLVPGTGTSGLPVVSVTRASDETWFQLEYVRRRNGELRYQPEISTNLVDFHPMTGAAAVTAIDDDWERVVMRQIVDVAATPALFGRVAVNQILTAATLFEGWTTSAGFTGSTAAAGAAPHMDGVANLVKYAFNLNPNAPDTRMLVRGSGTAGLPHFALERDASSANFVVEYVRRRNSGLVYTPKISTDLVTYRPMFGVSSTTAIDDSWERVIIAMPVDLATMPRLFGKVDVTLP